MIVTRKDFERLSQAQMEWSSNLGWKNEQEFRFDEDINWTYKYIYWFNEYVEALIASQYLVQTHYGYSISFDQATDQWVIVTDYAADWEK